MNDHCLITVHLSLSTWGRMKLARTQIGDTEDLTTRRLMKSQYTINKTINSVLKL